MDFCKSQHELDWGNNPIVICAKRANHLDDHEAYPFNNDAEFVVYWDDSAALPAL